MIDDALLDLLRPLVREIVREEMAKAREHWRWASVERASALLDLSPGAIYQRIARGQLPAKRLDRKLYIDLQALDTQLDLLP